MTRRDKLQKDASHDPTKRSKKLRDPAVCPDCGATYIEGRWTWRHGPVEAARHRCPACERIRDDYPAGTVTAHGAFVAAHSEEIVRNARNVEEREKGEHPMNRIMDVSEADDRIVFRTTETHLAQAIGKSLRRAYGGELEIDFQEDVVRVDWCREELPA